MTLRPPTCTGATSVELEPTNASSPILVVFFATPSKLQVMVPAPMFVREPTCGAPRQAHPRLACLHPNLLYKAGYEALKTYVSVAEIGEMAGEGVATEPGVLRLHEVADVRVWTNHRAFPQPRVRAGPRPFAHMRTLQRRERPDVNAVFDRGVEDGRRALDPRPLPDDGFPVNLHSDANGRVHADDHISTLQQSKSCLSEKVMQQDATTNLGSEATDWTSCRFDYRAASGSGTYCRTA